jgi:hypothetical protein
MEPLAGAPVDEDAVRAKRQRREQQQPEQQQQQPEPQQPGEQQPGARANPIELADSPLDDAAVTTAAPLPPMHAPAAQPGAPANPIVLADSPLEPAPADAEVQEADSGSEDGSEEGDSPPPPVRAQPAPTAAAAGFKIGGCTVRFPAGLKPHPPQLAMCSALLNALKNSNHALLESPTGTGKSLTCATTQAHVHISRKTACDSGPLGANPCGSIERRFGLAEAGVRAIQVAMQHPGVARHLPRAPPSTGYLPSSLTPAPLHDPDP